MLLALRQLPEVDRLLALQSRAGTRHPWLLAQLQEGSSQKALPAWGSEGGVSLRARGASSHFRARCHPDNPSGSKVPDGASALARVADMVVRWEFPSEHT